MMSALRPFAKSAVSWVDKCRRDADSVENLSRQLRHLQLRKQRKYHQNGYCSQYSTVSNIVVNHPEAHVLFQKGSFGINTIEQAKKRYCFVRHYSTSIIAPSLPSPSSKCLKNDEVHAQSEISQSLLSYDPSLPARYQRDIESFKVTKVTTETGEIETIQMSQKEILMRTRLSPRDLVSLRLTSKKELREDWIGNTLVEQIRYPPVIMARNDFILLSLGPVRAVAERDAVYIFDVHKKAARSFAKYLSLLYRRRSKRIQTDSKGNVNVNPTPTHDEEPTELVFIETVLADAVDSFSSRIRIFEPVVNDLLLRISTDEEFSDANLVHQMAPLKEQLKSFQNFVSQAYDCLTQLLNSDEDMLNLLLTEQEEARKANLLVDFERHQHVEHILGIYARRFSSIIQETNYLLGRIESKQEFVELELDLYRNRMIRMNIDLAIIATATGITTAFSGMLGMNTINGLEESSAAFATVSAISTVTALGVAYYFKRMVSGKTIQKRAEQRIGEIQTMSDALSDMTALDYTVKKMMRGRIMGRDEFKRELTLARQSNKCTDKEIDLLFNVLNQNDDDYLGKEDFLNKREREGTDY